MAKLKQTKKPCQVNQVYTNLASQGQAMASKLNTRSLTKLRLKATFCRVSGTHHAERQNSKQSKANKTNQSKHAKQSKLNKSKISKQINQIKKLKQANPNKAKRNKPIKPS